MKKIRKQIEGKWFYSLDGGKSFNEDPDQSEAGTTSPAALTPEEQAAKDAADAAAKEGGEGGEGGGEGGEGSKSVTQKDIDDAAAMVAKKLGELNDLREGQAKKVEKFNAGGARFSTTDPEVKLFKLKNGKAITMKQSQTVLVAEWFKSWVNFNTSHSPDAFYKMQEYRAKLNALDSATAVDGGNLVPTILYNVIIPLVEDMAVIRPNATVIDMTNIKTLDIPTIAGKPIMYIAGEATAKSSSSMQFGKVTLTPVTLASIVPITQQLIDYAPLNVVQIVSQAFAEAIAKYEDRYFLNGSGTSQPKGITQYSIKSIAAGGLFTWRHLNQLYFGITQAFRNKGVWIMGADAMSNLANQVDSQNRPIFDVAGVFQEMGLPSIKGRPVYENNDIGGTILFGDPTAYWVGASRQIRIDIAKEATIGGQNMFERNMIAIRAEEYFDGKLTDTRAFGKITGI